MPSISERVRSTAKHKYVLISQCIKCSSITYCEKHISAKNVSPNAFDGDPVTDKFQKRTMAEVHYRTVQINSFKIFYREAGSASLPDLLLLHGHASASHTFRNILPQLSDTFHVIAPDYPGFGNSDRPDPKDFPYTFVNLANTIDKFTEQLGMTRYTVYLYDFGAPIGLMLASKHPERISGLFT